MLVLANLCVRLFVLLHVLLENRDLLDRDTVLYIHKPVRDRRIFTYLIYYVISMKNITCRSEIAIKNCYQNAFGYFWTRNLCKSDAIN